MEFVAAINYGYYQFREVADFLCEHLGFQEVSSDDISVTVNNGVLSLRFFMHSNKELSLQLDVEATDYKETISKFDSIGFRNLGDHSTPTKFRVEQSFHGPFGLHLTIYQVLTEDDLGIPTDLKATLDWKPDAEKMAQDLLKTVAIAFRELARKKMVAQAESYAIVEGTMEVTREDVIKAFLYTTPYFKQDDMQNSLIEMGVTREYIDKTIAELDEAF